MITRETQTERAAAEQVLLQEVATAADYWIDLAASLSPPHSSDRACIFALKMPAINRYLCKMSNLDSKTLSEIKDMDVQSRLEAAEVLWDSIATGADELPLPEKHRRILDQREQSFGENPLTHSWAEVKRDISDLLER